jgi:hypothetical protein
MLLAVGMSDMRDFLYVRHATAYAFVITSHAEASNACLVAERIYFDQNYRHTWSRIRIVAVKTLGIFLSA